MKNSYIPKPKPPRADGRGRPVNPEKWVTGPDPHRREKYYAFLKHRAQCNFRNEDYELTFNDWETYWTDENYSQRGRRRTAWGFCRCWSSVSPLLELTLICYIHTKP